MNDMPTRSRLRWIGFYGWGRWRWFFRRRSLDLWSYGQYRRVTGPWWWLYYTLGLQSGEYSPPAPCLDFTAISSAISLSMPVRLRPSESGCHTDYCNWRRSSLSFPTSASRILTSLANAFVKSFTYLFKNDQFEVNKHITEKTCLLFWPGNPGGCFDIVPYSVGKPKNVDRSGRGRSEDLQPALAGLVHEAEYLFQFWQFPISADLETLWLSLITLWYRHLMR